MISVKKYFFFFIFSFLFFYGCTPIKKTSSAGMETFKVLWGSSTRALEEARVDAISQTYLCRFEECFNAVLSLGRDFRTPQPYNMETMFPSSEEKDLKESPEDSSVSSSTSEESIDYEQSYYVFIKDRTKKYIVIMDILGVINTTEVGIFFSNPTEQLTQVEIASLSPLAKEKAAEIIFHQLETLFPTPQENASLP